jgi:UDP-hydrolysing UDP-N-acetyl-D-glucosamine 2-epimerase
VRKICVIVTARPSYSRVKTALEAINQHPDLELILVLAFSAVLDRYGSMVAQAERDGFTPCRLLYTSIEGENLISMPKSTALGLLELATLFDEIQPDVVVTIADRYETMSAAIAAAYQNIPLCHLQGGELTGSIDEKVRHAVTKLADLHFVASIPAAERVRRMGEKEHAVFVTGCPSIDIAARLLESPELDFDPIRLYGGVGDTFDHSSGYVVVMQHPVTTEHSQARAHILETLHAVQQLDMPAFWFWPNIDAGSDGTSEGIRAFRELEKPLRTHFFKNMSPEHFLKLIHNSACLIGNSSVGIRECSFLGVPVVNIGSRQRGRDRGSNVVDVPHNSGKILDAARNQIKHGRYERDTLYGVGDSGRRIAHLLATLPLTTEKTLDY